jgi:hypothetical protein
MTRLRRCAILLGVLLLGSAADAQEQKAGTANQSQAAVPLFPRHRRGLYLNNDHIEVIDATPQSPPLEIDDPGVPDKGEYEINLFTGVDVGRDMRHVDVVTVDANYGIVLKGLGHELPTQVKFELPVAASDETDNPYVFGVGNAAFGLKFNFYNDDTRGLRASIYPQIEASTRASAARGVADAGQTLIVPLLVSHESKYVTWVGNVGLSKAFHAPGRETELDLGWGAGRPFFRKLAIMGDVNSTSSMDFGRDRLIAADAGFIYGVRKAIWYGRVGHSIFSDDGRHAFVGFGMKVIFDPR